MTLLDTRTAPGELKWAASPPEGGVSGSTSSFAGTPFTTCSPSWRTDSISHSGGWSGSGGRIVPLLLKAAVVLIRVVLFGRGAGVDQLGGGCSFLKAFFSLLTAVWFPARILEIFVLSDHVFCISVRQPTNYATKRPFWLKMTGEADSYFFQSPCSHSRTCCLIDRVLVCVH